MLRRLTPEVIRPDPEVLDHEVMNALLDGPFQPLTVRDPQMDVDHAID